MISTKRKKILGTKYSLGGRFHPSTDEMELVLYFGNDEETYGCTTFRVWKNVLCTK